MTVLTVVQQVCMMVGLSRPLAVFSASTREMQEMTVIANEAAAVIAKAADWQALLRIQTMIGNGVLDAFDLPTDYSRMLSSARLWSSRATWGLEHIADADDWLSLDTYPARWPLGAWTIYGGKLRIRPVMRTGETARFFYISKAIAGTKAAFTADGDVFVLDERLLKLCMVQLWKQAKGQDFAADLADYEMALDQERNRDKGSRPVVSGNCGGRRGGNVWPGTVGA